MDCFGYIYKLTSPSGKSYIGQTTKHVKYRWNAYKRLDCKKQQKLYRALLKYSPENFTYEIYDDTASNIDELNFLEDAYIAALDSIKNGYNSREGGLNGWQCKGRIMSEETKKKISLSNKGKIRTEQHKKNLSNSLKGRNTWNKGKKASEETRKRLSESHKGFKQTEESKIKRAESLKGIVFTEERKRNISLAKKGKGISPITLQKKKESEDKKRLDRYFEFFYSIILGEKNETLTN